jgi:hypothetical protein
MIALIRKIEEAAADVACEQLLDETPSKYGKDRQSRAKDILELLKLNDLAPKHIIDFAFNTYSMGSKYFLHKPNKNSKDAEFEVTPYTVEICKNSLLELICWLKNEIDLKGRAS